MIPTNADGAATRPQASHRALHFAAVIPFLAITFGLAWGVVALFVLLPETMSGLAGPISATNPFFFLAVYAPAVAAFVLVLPVASLRGLGRYLRRLLLLARARALAPRVFVGIPAVYVIAAAIEGTLHVEFAFATFGALLGAMGFMLILGPVEEFGWRGVLQPLLQRHMAPIWAGLVVGLIWGVWHLPAFLLSGTPQSGWDFMPFLVGATAVAVILTPFFNATRGSILCPYYTTSSSTTRSSPMPNRLTCTSLPPLPSSSPG